MTTLWAMGYDARANERRMSQFYDGRAMRLLKATEEVRVKFVKDRQSPHLDAMEADSAARARVLRYVQDSDPPLRGRIITQWRIALARLVKDLRALKRESLIG